MFDIETCIAFLTNNVSKKVKDAFNQQLYVLGITRVQWIALYYIGKNEELNQTQLGELMNIKGSSVATLLERMEEENYVEKRRNPQDRRQFNLYLTSQGEEIRKRVLPAGKKLSEVCAQGLSKEEIEIFKKVINQMMKNIEKM